MPRIEQCEQCPKCDFDGPHIVRTEYFRQEYEGKEFIGQEAVCLDPSCPLQIVEGEKPRFKSIANIQLRWSARFRS